MRCFQIRSDYTLDLVRARKHCAQTDYGFDMVFSIHQATQSNPRLMCTIQKKRYTNLETISFEFPSLQYTRQIAHCTVVSLTFIYDTEQSPLVLADSSLLSRIHPPCSLSRNSLTHTNTAAQPRISHSYTTTHRCGPLRFEIASSTRGSVSSSHSSQVVGRVYFVLSRARARTIWFHIYKIRLRRLVERIRRSEDEEAKIVAHNLCKVWLSEDGKQEEE